MCQEGGEPFGIHRGKLVNGVSGMVCDDLGSIRDVMDEVKEESGNGCLGGLTKLDIGRKARWWARGERRPGVPERWRMKALEEDWRAATKGEDQGVMEEGVEGAVWRRMSAMRRWEVNVRDLFQS
jgi:hypothetical protein